jgi:hypothetical protein
MNEFKVNQDKWLNKIKTMQDMKGEFNKDREILKKKNQISENEKLSN